MKNPQIENTTKLVNKNLKKLGVEDESAYANAIKNSFIEQQTSVQEQLAKDAIDRNIMPGSKEFQNFVSKGLAKDAKSLDAKSMQMMKVDYEKLSAERKGGIIDKLQRGVFGKGKVKFDRISRIRSGEST